MGYQAYSKLTGRNMIPMIPARFQEKYDLRVPRGLQDYKRITGRNMGLGKNQSDDDQFQSALGWNLDSSRGSRQVPKVNLW